MTRQPHDKLAKFVFSEAPQAAALLQAFLPPDISTCVDFSTLELVPGSFVDEALTERFTDLLFTVRAGKKRPLLYVLFEHQSTPDRIMPLRLLRSEVRIWDRWTEENPGARWIPPIVPLDDSTLARIRGADLRTLGRWIDRAPESPTLAEALE